MDCADGLSCLGGSCTRECKKAADCGDLHESATCVNSGAVRSCDITCERTVDCAEFSGRLSCERGVCRGEGEAVTPVSGAATLNAGSGGGKNNSADGQPQSGASTSGGASTGLGGAATSGGASPRDSALTSGAANASNDRRFVGLVPADVTLNGGVGACPEGTESDPMQIDYAAVIDGHLNLQLTHDAFCNDPEYYVCFARGFDQSNPVQGGLRVLLNAKGDACGSPGIVPLSFDLTAYADYYQESYQTRSGVIQTNYGIFYFGELNCTDRTWVAHKRVVENAERDDSRGCKTDDDCGVATLDTECSRSGCGAVVSVKAAADLETWRQTVSEEICGAFSEECDPLPLEPCPQSPAPRCVGGLCE